MQTSEIQAGQQYRSTNSNHLGWLVNVIRVSSLQVETEQITPNKGNKHAYPIDSFLRDYQLEKDIKHTNNNNVYQPDRICKVCMVLKPLDAQHFTAVNITRGNNKGQPAGYLKTCRDCVAAAKTKGLRRGLAERKNQSSHVMHSATPLQVVRTQESLSQRLLALATEAERLELQVPTSYTQLLLASRSLVNEAEYAHGVLVVKRETFEKLEQAIKNIGDNQ